MYSLLLGTCIPYFFRYMRILRDDYVRHYLTPDTDVRLVRVGGG